jgi:hypothetical protein
LYNSTLSASLIFIVRSDLPLGPGSKRFGPGSKRFGPGSKRFDGPFESKAVFSGFHFLTCDHCDAIDTPKVMNRPHVVVYYRVTTALFPPLRFGFKRVDVTCDPRHTQHFRRRSCHTPSCFLPLPYRTAASAPTPLLTRRERKCR